MVAIKGHFDGKVIVPDEPVDLVLGQRLVVHIEPMAEETVAPREPGSAKGTVWMAPDFDAPLEDFKEYME